VFNVPNMKVGSLDNVMAVADELGRADTFVENVVRKVERQLTDSYLAVKAAEAAAKAAATAGAGTATVAPAAIPPLEFKVNGVGVLEFVRKFTWDGEAWDANDSLPDLLKRLVMAAEKVDADVRAAGGMYQEKRTALMNAERKRR
jgi:hypothetical protein